MPILCLIDAQCGYRRQALLRSVNLQVHAGQRLAIVGDNGEGKSTLLHSMMGMIPLLSGERRCRLRRDQTGYVGQRLSMDFPLRTTVAEFVSLGMNSFQRSREREAQILQHALEAVDLWHRQNDDLSLLSGGQFQRVVLAKSMVNGPPLLYLDEPTTGMDRKSRQEFMERLCYLSAERQLAIVMVVHDFRFLSKNFTHLAWVQAGEVKLKPVAEWLADKVFLDFCGNDL